jgi:hypothetical protein
MPRKLRVRRQRNRRPLLQWFTEDGATWLVIALAGLLWAAIAIAFLEPAPQPTQLPPAGGTMPPR